MVRISIEIDGKKGLVVSSSISPMVLRALLTGIAGLVSLPWLVQIGQAFGWL